MLLQTSLSAFIKWLHCIVSYCGVLLLFSTHFQNSATLVVPNELPSILSLVYSNIPPIKKGMDSRLGFGFRLGEHADFQVLIELGPQKDTRPIGKQDDTDGSSFNKRQVDKKQQLRLQSEVSSTEHSATSWMEKWSNDANLFKKKAKLTKKQFANKPYEIPMMPQLPEQTMKQLQMLYKMAITTPTATADSKIHYTYNETSPEPNGQIKSATHLQERLKTFKTPIVVEELQNLQQHKPAEKTKSEIPKELMDVNLDK